ncbi:NUDIX hydrolase [Paenibacillus sp. GCM10027626]|uniref:NUDIX hydrolase n=1 Tax=Paenibacillus sp. GCM10027626 TaxID=3273411 RepID=UPI003644FBAA
MVAVSAYVENENGEVLLLRTHWRSETWELPGGFVEAGEPLDEAVCREFMEETGIRIRPLGITGVYYNKMKHVLSVVFRAQYISGEIKIQEEEILEAKFVRLTDSNMDEYLTWPHVKSRTLDAMKATTLIPYETWELDPPSFNLLSRLNPESHE